MSTPWASNLKGHESQEGPTNSFQGTGCNMLQHVVHAQQLYYVPPGSKRAPVSHLAWSFVAPPGATSQTTWNNSSERVPWSLEYSSHGPRVSKLWRHTGGTWIFQWETSTRSTLKHWHWHEVRWSIGIGVCWPTGSSTGLFERSERSDFGGTSHWETSRTGNMLKRWHWRTWQTDLRQKKESKNQRRPEFVDCSGVLYITWSSKDGNPPTTIGIHNGSICTLNIPVTYPTNHR